MGKPFCTYKCIAGHWYKYEVVITEKSLGRVTDEEALAHRRKSSGRPWYGQPIHDKAIHDKAIHDKPIEDKSVSETKALSPSSLKGEEEVPKPFAQAFKRWRATGGPVEAFRAYAERELGIAGEQFEDYVEALG